MSSVANPIYYIRFFSGSTTRHIFGSGSDKQIISASIKPGLTNTIGNFEITIPDVSGSNQSGGSYSNILPFEDVEVYLGYDETGSMTFKGKVETIKSELGLSDGYTRTFIGSDYGECLPRILANRAYPSNSGDTIVQGLRNACTGSTKGGLSTSNAQIASDTETYEFVFESQDIFSALKQYADSSNKDFYIDTDKLLHTFERQSATGSEVFSVGSNVLEYSVTEDLTPVKNDIFVFGDRNNSSSGSDVPSNHDYWTEEDTTDWTAERIETGSTINLGYSNSDKATGSASIIAQWESDTVSGSTWTVKLSKDFSATPVMCTSEDKLHLYFKSDLGGRMQNFGHEVRLFTGDTSNYFYTRFEPVVDVSDWFEIFVDLGAPNEGQFVTGSQASSSAELTGSYKWLRSGDPDWLNITGFELLGYYEYVSDGIWEYLQVDGLYFSTAYQAHKSGSESIDKYGLRRLIRSSNDYNSYYYCENVASVYTGSLLEPVTQISLTVTGSEKLSMGSMYSVVIPAEGINKYMQLIDLEHVLDENGFVSKCILTDKKELRTIIPTINWPVAQAEQHLSFWDALLRIFSIQSPNPVVCPST